MIVRKATKNKTKKMTMGRKKILREIKIKMKMSKRMIF